MRASMTMLSGVASRLVIATLLLFATAVSASAETLMMPTRDARMGTSMVVWGVTTQANGSPYTIDFGDATSVSGNVVDRSYIAFNHTYATQGTFTVTLTVGIEVATVAIRVFDVALLPGGAAGDANRGLGINMAIEDGLRYLWTSQVSRAGNFPVGVTTNWGHSFPVSLASMVVLAFENHGYKLPNNAGTPTGLYEKYIVRRGLNFVMSQLSALALSVQPAGTPCVAGLGVAAGDCGGLQPTGGDLGYQTAVVMLPFAASGALSRVNTEVAGATFNKTYGEILQRLVNSEAFGQTDSGAGRGGFGYHHNGGQFDGSTIGWSVLGFLDAEAAGATVPAFVRTEFAIGFANALNNDGSFDYSADSNPAVKSAVNPQKAGIGLQGLYFLGTPGPFAVGSKGANALTYISDHWPGAYLSGDYTGWNCNPSASKNKGCGYTMFNNFKGLKLNGVTTLPGVTRPAGPGAQPAGDWYADYQDWLVANQTSPTTTTGGYWSGMGFSCCYSNNVIGAAVAELILSPVALVLPDGDKFAAVGLAPATNSALELTTHTVTAHAESTGGTPVPGATVNFVILTGPNAGLTGSDTTDSNGEATFTYTDQGPAGTTGTDTIQASIGAMQSNIVEMTWTPINTAPVCTIVPSITSIWPPNHKMVSVTASGATDAEGGPLTYAVVSIFQDEPTNTNGDGNTAIDGAGIGTSTAQVRAERTGDPKNPGDGRVYHITFSVTDSLGLSCQATVTVGVPHDQSGKVQPIDGGALFDSTVAGPPSAATSTGKGKGN